MHLCSASTVDETGRGKVRHSCCEQADQPWQSDTHVRHPATVAVSMCNRVNDLEVAFSGDD